ncbi:glycosyltransferase [Pullulanibacillus sp. KACC 23026]|uniref:glycosyltransferase family 2 protein n=1 Tax=Pullulanibacillus sp. KACC 23026 TaxID=3028315 RepID=UPI0023B0FEC8|nr:glycosyltransferase [Pullulanibacillus sp. KACC 23026]WEG11500.1 glycosyltransferase [Pullulanibacillus sp. KACC 23026]
MEPLVSIIVPVYNVEPYLSSCIDSILAQTFKAIEIILVDDGSEDGSLKICNQYTKIDKRVKVIKKRNRGVSSARNVGIDNARGLYIGFVDPDDTIEPNMYSAMVDVMVKMKPDVVVAQLKTDNQIINKVSVSEVWKDVDCPINQSVIRDEIMPMVIGGKRFSLMHCVNKLYKRSCFQNRRFDETRNHGEDARFNLLLLSMVESIVFLDQPLYNYVIRKRESLTVTFRPNLYDYLLDNRNFGRKLCSQYHSIFLIRKIENEFILSTLNYIQSIVESSLSRKEKKNLIKRIINDDQFTMSLNKCKCPSWYYTLLKKLCKKREANLILFFVQTKLLVQKYIYKVGSYENKPFIKKYGH